MKEILTRAREILTPEGAWIQNYPAMDSRGNSRDPEDRRASSWCLVGALERAAYDSSDSDPECTMLECAMLECATFALQAALGRDALAAWNDAPGRTREEVLHLLDRAIAA